MSAAAPSLRHLQQVFRDLGINDDVQIASHVAFLLLVRDQWERIADDERLRSDRQLVRSYDTAFSNKDTPVCSTFLNHLRSEGRTQDVLRGMIGRWKKHRATHPTIDHLGTFFQREIRFELLKSASGSQYPTPHHLATFMASLAISEANLSRCVRSCGRKRRTVSSSI